MTLMDPAIQFETLLDRVEKDLRSSLLPVEIFSDDLVFRMEMERIFARCWVFLAHQSEVPQPGDYVLRRIGLDQVIVVRDEGGRVSVLSNHCRHRGTLVCQADQGNASHFRCPYHGWIYKNDGRLLGAPHSNRAYEDLDQAQWGLLSAAHVDTYQGLIFATLASDAPPLEEYLGGAAWMLDAALGLHPDGMRVMGPPDRWRIKTDWKSGAENFGGDTYHTETAHVSLADVGLAPEFQGLNEHARHYDLGNGNTFLGHGMVDWLGSEWRYWGYPDDLVAQFDLSRLDSAQRLMIEQRPPVTGTMFPNLTYLRFAGSPDPGVQPLGVYTSLRQWQPVAPGVMELWSWQLTWNCASDEYSAACYAAGQNGFSSSGVFEQDDTVVWEGLPTAARSTFARKNQMSLNYQMGIGGTNPQKEDADWGGPGKSWINGFGEQNQLSFYHRWLAEMQRPA